MGCAGWKPSLMGVLRWGVQDGNTALMAACLNNQPYVVNVLLEHKCDPNMKVSPAARTPFSVLPFRYSHTA